VESQRQGIYDLIYRGRRNWVGKKNHEIQNTDTEDSKGNITVDEG
jgi:hypothetical protein